MRRIVLLAFVIPLIGCDPAQSLALHNDLGEPAEVVLRFRTPSDGSNVRETQMALSDGERAQQTLSWSVPDWIEFAWRSRKGNGRQRFKGVDVIRTDRNVYLRPGGVVFGPLTWSDALDDKLGALKPFVVLAGAFALFGWFRRKSSFDT